MFQLKIEVSSEIAAKCDSWVTGSSQETAFGRLLYAWHHIHPKTSYPLCTITIVVYVLKG